MTKIMRQRTEVPALKTISQIEKLLAEAGASRIFKEFDAGYEVPSKLSFSLSVNGNEVFFQIPCNISAVEKILDSNRKHIRSEILRERAERTAWRIVFNWVEVQVAMIQMKQAEAMQVFMPYAIEASTNETIYKRFARQLGILKLSAGEQ